MVGDARRELKSPTLPKRVRKGTKKVRFSRTSFFKVFKWSGTRDSNSQPHAPKACALANCASPRSWEKMVGIGRFELPTSRLSVVRSNQLSYTPIYRKKVESEKKIILLTLYFLLLSNGAGDGTRTHNPLLGRQML